MVTANGRTIEVRLDRCPKKSESVSRFLDNGIPLFATIPETEKALDPLDEGHFKAVDGEQQGITGVIESLFGVTQGLKPNARIAERSLGFELSLKNDAEAQLMRAFKIGEEEEKKFDLFLANWPSWLAAQRSQMNALTQLNQLKLILSAIEKSQSLEDLKYPNTTPSPDKPRPLFKCFDAISTSTQTVELENISLAVARRLAGIHQIRKDLFFARESFTAAAKDMDYFLNIVTELSGDWNLFSPSNEHLTAIATSEEFDFKSQAEVWIDILTIPNAIWGIEEEVSKAAKLMESIRFAKNQDEQRLEGEIVEGGGTGSQATSLLASYFKTAEEGEVVAPSGSWPPFPAISPFTSCHAVLRLKKWMDYGDSIDELSKDKRYRVQIDMKGDIGWWIEQKLHLQVRLRPTKIRRLVEKEYNPLQTQPDACVLCGSVIEDAVDEGTTWKQGIICSEISLGTSESLANFPVSLKSKGGEYNVNRAKMTDKIDSVLRGARIIAVHRAIFIICQIQAATYLTKGPTDVGEGALKVSGRGKTLEDSFLSLLPVYSVGNKRPIPGSKGDIDCSSIESSVTPWLYLRDRSLNKGSIMDLFDSILLDHSARCGGDLIRIELNGSSPIGTAMTLDNKADYDLLFDMNPKLVSWDSSTTRFLLVDAPLFVNLSNNDVVSGYVGDIEVVIGLGKSDEARQTRRGVPCDLCRDCKFKWIKQWQTLEVLATARIVQLFAEKWIDGGFAITDYWKSSNTNTNLVTEVKEDNSSKGDNSQVAGGRHFLESFLTWLSKVVASGGPKLVTQNANL